MGAAFIVPNAVALLMHTFPPGKLRNIAMGLFGASKLLCEKDVFSISEC